MDTCVWPVLERGGYFHLWAKNRGTSSVGINEEEAGSRLISEGSGIKEAADLVIIHLMLLLQRCKM